MTSIVNLRIESYDVYIGRPGKGMNGYFGNSHPVGYCEICRKEHQRGEAIAEFKKDFYRRIMNDKEFLRRVLELKDKTLGCFCKPMNQCHGEIIAEWLDSLPSSS
jgi:hypothetical protein